MRWDGRNSYSVGRLLATLLAVCLPGHSLANAATTEDYARADKIRAFDDRTLGGLIYPHWLPDGIRFTYFSWGGDDERGFVYIVDPRNGSKRKLFEARGLAAALSKTTGTRVDFSDLPPWQLVNGERAIATVIAGKPYLCVLDTMQCALRREAVSSENGVAMAPAWATRSPDGRWDAFVWNYNLYIRPARLNEAADIPRRLLAADGDGNSHFGRTYGYYGFQPTGQRAGCDNPAPPGSVDLTPPPFQPVPAGSIQLTSDGSRLYSYGPRWKGGAEVATLDADRYRPAGARIIWSPDSRKLVIRREDIRGVGSYPLYSSTSDQPVDHSYFYAVPGATHIPQYDLYVVDIGTRGAIKVNIPPIGSVLQPGGEQWSTDSRHLLAIGAVRGLKSATLYAVNPDDGTAKSLIRETSKTFVELSSGSSNPVVAVDEKSGDIFWFSERSGWGHLYRYDAQGALKNQVDTGENVVSEIIHVDGAARQIYFAAWGREPANPYYRHLFRINFDGSNLTALTPEPGDHQIQWFPAGNYFLDLHQSIDVPPDTTVRRADGTLVLTVSQGSDKALRVLGWRPAETFSVKARDGVTDLYGVMYRPHNFDPSKRYPVVVNIYPGPFTGSVGDVWRFQGGDNFGPREDESRRLTHGEGMSQSLAELGFIVIKLNALGSAQRSKAMQDFFHGNMIDNGLPDQVAAVEQLARRHAWIDRDKVGIFGHSAGGFAAATGMLTHPDMFKVGVAEAGNHDIRTYGWYWGEQYQGALVTPADAASYAKQADLTYAANLRGKLLLIHGDMDCNDPPAQTLRLADALIRNKKPFDMMIVPEAGHQLPSFAMQRAWDYFVKNLAEGIVPADYRVGAPE